MSAAINDIHWCRLTKKQIVHFRNPEKPYSLDMESLPTYSENKRKTLKA
jgi:hypothetical protein